MQKMKAGESLPAVEVLEYNGKKYVIDGHHGLEAALGLNWEIEYKSVTMKELQQRGSFKNVDEVLNAAAEKSVQKSKT